MARKIGGVMARAASMQLHSRGVNNASIYDFLKGLPSTGGSTSPVTDYDFTIDGQTVSIEGREVTI